MPNAQTREDPEDSHAGSTANPVALNAIVRAAEIYSIVASEDIVDVRGVKLWAKNQPVSASLQQRLLERKLSKPLESCLAAEDGVSLITLQEDFERFMAEPTPLVQGLRPWAEGVGQQLRQLPLHSVAQLLLTTALANRPEMVTHAVQAMALMGALATKYLGQAMDVRMAMLAGLLHDIGEIYIQPEYLDPGRSMDLLGHKHLVVHPRVAQLLLDSTTDYPRAIGRAVGEHHERLNGSGYPARLRQPDLSPLGRMLAVTEVTLGIARAQSAPLTRASFALRVLPGEFDPQYIGFISDMARRVAEPAVADVPAPASLVCNPLAEIQQRAALASELHAQLQALGGEAQALEIADTASTRLERLKVAWNSLGYWGAQHAEITVRERLELHMADRELGQRLRDLDRECLLLAERISPLEREMLSPLWQSLHLAQPPQTLV
ncbi:HD-GYP domain-containing protein [Acidovorax sp. 1608163]|uniref:HD-GYP domain-containing protein n=1 Tax=Acidovorax sp. 1608163 TaxID=2478662 RepID=UPI0013CEA129|nr:HD domain-containing phosphohydrolase [Acidovorax sp. 1608163]